MTAKKHTFEYYYELFAENRTIKGFGRVVFAHAFATDEAKEAALREVYQLHDDQEANGVIRSVKIYTVGEMNPQLYSWFHLCEMHRRNPPAASGGFLA